jgi:hypothetical protein
LSWQNRWVGSGCCSQAQLGKLAPDFIDSTSEFPAPTYVIFHIPGTIQNFANHSEMKLPSSFIGYGASDFSNAAYGTAIIRRPWIIHMLDVNGGQEEAVDIAIACHAFPTIWRTDAFEPTGFVPGLPLEQGSPSPGPRMAQYPGSAQVLDFVARPVFVEKVLAMKPAADEAGLRHFGVHRS